MCNEYRSMSILGKNEVDKGPCRSRKSRRTCMSWRGCASWAGRLGAVGASADTVGRIACPVTREYGRVRFGRQHWHRRMDVRVQEVITFPHAHRTTQAWEDGWSVSGFGWALQRSGIRFAETGSGPKDLLAALTVCNGRPYRRQQGPYSR
jgi:hypothetical protein